MKAEAATPVQQPGVPPRDDEDAGPRLELSARGFLVFGAFVLVAAVALYFLLPQLAGLNDTWHRIEEGSPVWLAVAALLTVGMFGGYVALFRAIFRNARLGWGESYQVTMAALAASRLLSAGGAGGLVLQAWALRRAGMGAREVADGTVTFIVMTYLVYMAALVVFGVLLYLGVLPGNDVFALSLLPAILAAAVTAAGLSLAFVPPDLQRRVDAWVGSSHGHPLLVRLARIPASISAGMREALVRIRDRDPAMIGAVLFWAFQIAVLWASFCAFGDAPPVAVLVMGFFVGMLGNLLPLPGGIGGVDGGMIGAFAGFGVDFGLAAVAVLAYRAFTFWLPTVPGVLAYLQLRRTVERWRVERRTRATAATA